MFLASGLHMNSDHIFTFIDCFTAEDSKFWALWPFEILNLIHKVIGFKNSMTHF